MIVVQQFYILCCAIGSGYVVSARPFNDHFNRMEPGQPRTFRSFSQPFIPDSKPGAASVVYNETELFAVSCLEPLECSKARFTERLPLGLPSPLSQFSFFVRKGTSLAEKFVNATWGTFSRHVFRHYIGPVTNTTVEAVDAKTALIQVHQKRKLYYVTSNMRWSAAGCVCCFVATNSGTMESYGWWECRIVLNKLFNEFSA